MSDPFEELRRLDRAVAARRLDAAEVRRRGDRVRRRRTLLQATGVAAAVAVIASGGALMTGDLTGSTPPPTPATRLPTPQETDAPAEAVPEGGWTTEIPEQLERTLDDSFWAGVMGSTELDEPWKGLPCGDPGRGVFPKAARESLERPYASLPSTWLALDEHRTDQSVDVLFGVHRFQGRQLVVYRDGRTADAAVATIRRQVESCAATSDDRSAGEPRWSVQPFAFGGDDGLLITGTEVAGGDRDRVVARTLIGLVRRGNAVLTASLSHQHSGPADDLTDDAAAGLVDDTSRATARLCVFAVDACGPDDAATFVTDVPGDFPIDRGLPRPGGDVPEWTWSTEAATPLSAVACGDEQPLPATPRSALRVQVDPPDEQVWRHAMVFEDVAAADALHAEARAAAGRCAEGQQGVPAHERGPSEVRWSFAESTRGAAALLEIEGSAYATGTEVRVPGRTLTTLVQVGNIVLVARMDNASSAAGEDAVTRKFRADVDHITARMCRLAGASCP
jgi:hypothetical protein